MEEHLRSFLEGDEVGDVDHDTPERLEQIDLLQVLIN